MTKKYTKKPYKRYNKKRAKWRQQKLAVGTVQKIAREIARKEDSKNIHKYCHVAQVKAPGYIWSDPRYLPATINWETVAGNDQNNQIKYKLISGLGGNQEFANMTQQDQAERGQVELRLHGVQCYGIVKNNSPSPMRVEIRLVFVPNLNQFTDDAVDYLTPRISHMFRSGKGGGNLLNQGYNRKNLGSASATGVPINIQILAKKVLFLPPASVNGTVLQNQQLNPITLLTPVVYKRFSLFKYFKNARKAYARASAPELSNGNYYLVYWSDASTTGTFSILATTNLQYSLRSPMKPDDP